MFPQVLSHRPVRWVAAKERFASIKTQIVQDVQAAFARAPRQRREELVGRAIRHARKVFVQLARRGFMDLAYPHPLAAAGVKQARAELRRTAHHHVQC